jgi:hypothetical protein
MKENHRVESLKALSQSARRKRIRRFESSARVYAYSFDNANESKLSSESSTFTKNHKDWMHLLQAIEFSAGQIRLARDQKEGGILGLFKRC